MKGSLHYKITFNALIEEGFNREEAHLISKHCVLFDKYYIFKPFAHFRKSGAFILSGLFLYLAKIFNSQKLLGWAVHSLQDAISHGSYFPWQHNRISGIDEVSDKALRTEIFNRTKDLAKKFIEFRKRFS
ncbi:MAG: hypothetical protein N2440_01150 [Actinobacteria bacterium]|nr:hypothetical protein [Actinomycetota bacterium]